MRRIASHLQLIAALVALSIGCAAFVGGTAWGAATPNLNSPSSKAQLNKAVQEALAKAQAEKSGGGSAAGSSSSGAGAASSEAFSKLTSGASSEEEEAKAQTSTSSASETLGTSSSKISSSLLISVVIVVVLLLAGIAYMIVRDARKVAPAGDAVMAARSSHEQAAIRMRKRRAKAKAARQQRKRNR
jgi:cobalamin biosynthesis Mg chelatase CobN